MKKIPIIIDCDPGKDDAFAILHALKEEKLDVRLISTVSGNVPVEQTTHNALGLTHLAKASVPVMKGASKPLFRDPVFASEVHGKSGLGGFSFADDEIDLAKEGNVLDEMYKIITEFEHEIVLVPIGPLTNIAKLMMLYPDVVDKISKISLMGGGLKGGNTTLSGEFNFYADPEAAKIVFESGVPIIMAGLDVTEKATINEEEAKHIKTLGHIGEVLYEIIVLAPYRREDGVISQLNDLISILVLTNPEIFDFEDMNVHISIENGLTKALTVGDQRISSMNDEKKHKVLLDLNHQKFLDLVYEGISKYE